MKRKGKKKLIIVLVSLVLVAAIGVGIFFISKGEGEPVNVYPFEYLGMTEYWGDSQESYGPVSTDKIQTVFVTDTQKVTEVLVAEGDMVKKGDVLMTFDTTLSDLQMQRKELEIERMKLQLSETRGYLVQLKKMEPYDPNYVPPAKEENLGTALVESYLLSSQKQYDGSSADKALICWLKDTTNVGEELFEIIRQQSEQFQNDNAQEAWEIESQLPPETTPEGETLPPPVQPEYINVEEFYVVFKVTKDNMSLGNRLQWQGVHVTLEGNTFRFRFFDPIFMKRLCSLVRPSYCLCR